MSLSIEQIKKQFGYDDVSPFFEGLARVRKDGQRFHIRRNGQPAYSEKYEYVDSFSEGLAACARKKGQWFHIRPDGQPAYSERYDRVGPFLKGLAWAQKNGQCFQIRYNGQKKPNG
jgi:hypothetical protein